MTPALRSYADHTVRGVKVLHERYDFLKPPAEVIVQQEVDLRTQQKTDKPL